MSLLQNEQYSWAALHVATHVIGSVGLCFAGFATYKALA
jgi:CrcB protein